MTDYTTSTLVLVVDAGDLATPTNKPPQSTDPIFDTVDLPHDPVLGPVWDGQHLTTDHPDAYHADFTLGGVSLFGLTGSDPLSG